MKNVPSSTMHLHSDGSQLWLDGKNRPHRENAPAFIRPDGMTLWFYHGVLIAEGYRVKKCLLGRLKIIAPSGKKRIVKKSEFYDRDSVFTFEENDPLKGVVHKKLSYNAKRWEKIHMRDSLIWFDSEGKLHRENAPAIIGINRMASFEIWYCHGKIHRVGAPAKTTTSMHHKSKFWGHTKWFQNGLPHNKGAPSVISHDGTRKWHVNGKLHRTDGAAVEHPDGRKEFWINGTRQRIER